MGFLRLAVVFSLLFVFSGCAPQYPSGDGRGGSSREDPPEAEGKILSASTGDVRGGPVPGLPRPPGAVRVGYSEGRADGLALVRAEYLTKKGPGAVREFYRDAFGARDWRVANVEYSTGDWAFLALRGEREAEVVIKPHGGGSEVGIEFSEPAAGGQEARSSVGGSKR